MSLDHSQGEAFGQLIIGFYLRLSSECFAPTLLTRNLNQNVVYLPENSCKILSAFVGYRIHDYTNLFGGEYYCWK